MSSYVGITQDLVITGKVPAAIGAFGRLSDILKISNSRQDARMLLSPLNEEELASLLQKQAFEPEDVTDWSRPRLRWVLVSALLALVSLCALYRWYLQQPQLPPPMLLEWQQGSPVAIDRPALLTCLQQWGNHQSLPAAEHILLEPSDLGWSVIWISAQRTYNYQWTEAQVQACH
jgi:hypothetical protein